MSSPLAAIMSIASSGLQVAQTGLDTVSNNLANVNTTGYVREVAEQQSTALAGIGSGVETTGIVRATNQYLEGANLSAQSDASSASALYSLIDQAQTLFGDPSSTDSFFSSLDNVFSAFSTLEANPTSDQEAAAVQSVSQFFSGAQTVQSGLQSLVSQADGQISSDVAEANQLLGQINALNTQISQFTVEGKDATGSQNQQSQLISQLASLMNITTSTGTNGAVTVRAGDGTTLVGGGQVAVFSYDTSGPTGQLEVTPPGGTPQAVGSRLSSGELAGLIQARNTTIPSIQSQLAELVNQTANQLNAVSNASSSTPAPASLTGRDTGQNAATAFSGFTGKTNVDVVNSAGVVQKQVTIDFGAKTMTVGGVSTAFTASNFATVLNTELGSAGSASFSNGQLSISAANGNGVAIADDPTDPSQKAGQGFSDFFGLNDLVTAAGDPDYDTGLTSSSANAFAAGGAITLRLSDAGGSTLKTVAVNIPSGGTMSSVLAALNDRATGVGLYGSFQLDASGELSFQPTSGSGVSLSVASDTTAWGGAGGPTLTQMFGIGDAQRIATANSYGVRSDIAEDPTLLQTGQLNLSAAAGTSALPPGDTSGADAMAQAGQTLVQFSAAGDAAATTLSLSDYSAQLSGSIANTASAAQSAQSDATATASEAQSQLSSAEGVNIDQELVSLTTYQQAYNASARMMQAAQDMFQTLITMTES